MRHRFMDLRVKGLPFGLNNLHPMSSETLMKFRQDHPETFGVPQTTRLRLGVSDAKLKMVQNRNQVADERLLRHHDPLFPIPLVPFFQILEIRLQPDQGIPQANDLQLGR